MTNIIEERNIDLDQILNILRTGIRRADVFMGIGLNAADQEPPISHVLAHDGLHQIALVKEHLTDTESFHVREEFGKWIRANGLRELIETFSIYLYEMYQVHCILQRDTQSAQFCKPKEFERKGVGDQMEQLSKMIEISETDIRIVRSLNQMRNCYAHRRGRVGKIDTNSASGKLQIIWIAMQLQMVEPDGNVVAENEVLGKVFKYGASVQLCAIKKEKFFALNEEVVLTKAELKEICLSLLGVGERLHLRTIEMARKIGVFREYAQVNANVG